MLRGTARQPGVVMGHTDGQGRGQGEQPRVALDVRGFCGGRHSLGGKDPVSRLQLPRHSGPLTRGGFWALCFRGSAGWALLPGARTSQASTGPACRLRRCGQEAVAGLSTCRGTYAHSPGVLPCGASCARFPPRCRTSCTSFRLHSRPLPSMPRRPATEGAGSLCRPAAVQEAQLPSRTDFHGRCRRRAFWAHGCTAGARLPPPKYL